MQSTIYIHPHQSKKAPTPENLIDVSDQLRRIHRLLLRVLPHDEHQSLCARRCWRLANQLRDLFESLALEANNAGAVDRG